MAETAADTAIESIERALDAAPGSERVRFWWRDDDATARTPQLERLLRLSAGTGVPVNLSVVPGTLDRTLVDCLHDHPGTAVLVHGWMHTNHGPEGILLSEFPATRSAGEIRAELSTALSTLRQAFQEQ